MSMLADFRSVVWGHLASLPPVVLPSSNVLVPALHPEIPSDLAELPALVVGLPTGNPNDLDGTYEPTLDVYVIAHPNDTPGRDTALLHLADAVFDHFGGTRGTKIQLAPGDVWHLTTQTITPRNVIVGDISDYPAYLLTIESAYRTC